MTNLKIKNPVLPHGGINPVVVTETTQNQNSQLVSGKFLGVESSIPKGGWRGSESAIPKGGWRGVESSIPKGGWRGAESSIPEGGWRVAPPVLRDVYRTTTGHMFEFAFYLVNDRYYEIDILSAPDYGSHDTGYHATHRLGSNHGNTDRICFGDDSNVATLDDARKWAATWAEHTMKYIISGTSFPNN